MSLGVLGLREPPTARQSGHVDPTRDADVGRIALRSAEQAHARYLARRGYRSPMFGIEYCLQGKIAVLRINDSDK